MTIRTGDGVAIAKEGGLSGCTVTDNQCWTPCHCNPQDQRLSESTRPCHEGTQAGTQRSRVDSELGGAITHLAASQDHLQDAVGKSLLDGSIMEWQGDALLGSPDSRHSGFIPPAGDTSVAGPAQVTYYYVHAHFTVLTRAANKRRNGHGLAIGPTASTPPRRQSSQRKQPLCW